MLACQVWKQSQENIVLLKHVSSLYLPLTSANTLHSELISIQADVMGMHITENISLHSFIHSFWIFM